MRIDFFIVFIVLLSLDYIVELTLSILNNSYQTGKIPKILVSFINKEDYAKSISYEKENNVFSVLISTKTFIITLVLLFYNGFGIIDKIANSLTSTPLFHSLVFFGIIALFFGLIMLPFDLYQTFVIEEKYGFNKSSFRLFFLDKIKGIVVSIILVGGLLALIFYLYSLWTHWFWFIAWLSLSLIMLIFSMFYSQLIVPLFNKQKPLEEGELRNKIVEFAKKYNFSLNNIYVIDGSKRSSKANAYFTGLGSKKRIVLYDTLIEQQSKDELLAILAHEIGHYKHKHTLKGIVIGIIQTGIYLYLFSLFLNLQNSLAIEIANAFGTVPSFHISLISFGLLLSPISLIISPLMNYFSRKNEYQADAFAAESVGSKYLGEALIKLSKNHLSKLEPHPWYVFFHYSHPSLLQRLKGMGFKNEN